MFSERTWIGAIAAVGMAIAVVAGWVCFAYGNVLDQALNRPGASALVAGLFLLAFTAILLRGTIFVVRRWRKTDWVAPTPGRWALGWVSFQMACLLALAVLGAAAIAALPFGYARFLFQAFMLVLVASALLFLAGGAVRDFARVARSFG